jgi:hypothetical protein
MVFIINCLSLEILLKMVFGCKAYAVMPAHSRNKENGKMADKAIEGIMVGYSSNHKAYKIFS